MWSEILINYGVFILEIITLLLVIVAIAGIILAVRKQDKDKAGELKIIDLKEQYQENQTKLKNFRLSETILKAQEKQEKKLIKEEEKAEKARLKKATNNLSEPELKSCLFVINFNGDPMASQTSSLREVISAILQVARPEKDEVLLRLESPGGVVQGYGLAASQLKRIKQKGIKLTIAVDQVAASGGYMMACVADKIVSAPFAIVGSIGVVAQLPNIHRFLKKHDVDVDVMTAGEFKRTMTVLGENTEKGKQKFQQDLDNIHQLFKQFVVENRPHITIDTVATGEYWFGQQALELGLIDEIATSDDLILAAIENEDKDVLEVKYHTKRTLGQKLGKQAEQSVDNLLIRWWQRTQKPWL
ncbi:protease SohB [Mergibacter septicus]|uniref:Protease SohB n=1 Tax=Mergibacter septicus TaxID=221402 RepID=A0A8D4IXK9_9PAST|nr:protease SohB [Mergibacter septicus]AWX15279.1 protease SohB [Mergibacter septicus]QDJ14533.1 protease SohB [Mergibacter septicus]UTU48879.1 protease SohB [Mergibacter septicus]WMR96817.1 protease SohB [Mergibacter septicus]